MIFYFGNIENIEDTLLEFLLTYNLKSPFDLESIFFKDIFLVCQV